MPRRCSVPGCRSNYDTQSTHTTTFAFPKKEQQRLKWLSTINRKKFTPGSSAAVCINHFDERFIIREDKFVQKDGSTLVIPRKILALVEDAYPTQFANQPHYLSKDLPTIRKTLYERSSEILKRDEKKFKEWCETDKIKSFNDMKDMVGGKLADSWQCETQENSIFVYKIEVSDCPKVPVSFQVLSDFTVNVYSENIRLDTKTVLGFTLGTELKLDKWTKLDSVLSFLSSFQVKEMSVDQKFNTIKLLLNEIIEVDAEGACSDKLKFISDQLVSAVSKQHRYNSDTILWCADLYFRYPAAYSLIRKSGNLTLPHQSYLRNLTASLCKNNESNPHGPGQPRGDLALSDRA